MEWTFRDSLNERLTDPEFRAEWEALETERQINMAIIEGKPLTGFTPELIAKAADVSLEEAEIMRKGKQARPSQPGKRDSRAAVR